MGGQSAKMVAAYISARAGLKGHDDAIHTIHAGTDHNVELRLSDLKVVIENYAAMLELLAALTELNDALDDGFCNSGTPGFDSKRLGVAQDAARAAIAKATGAA